MVYICLVSYVSHDGTTKVGGTYGHSSKFSLPKNMTLSDACKVISYLSQKVEKEQRLNPASEANVVQTSQILHNYGFKKIKGTQGGRSHGVSLYTPCPKINDIVPEESDTLDLFTICGDVKLFKKFRHGS